MLEIDVLNFLLDVHIKFGDSPTSSQARMLKAKLKAQNEGYAALMSAFSHEGGQSPLPKSDSGLGGREPADGESSADAESSQTSFFSGDASKDD